LVWSWLFVFVSGVVTYFWFGHLGLFWYGLRVVLVRSTFQMNTASKLGPHTQTDRGTCPGVGL
jgi:hypothetical protein